MNQAARLGGLTLSLVLHAGVIMALLAWSDPEWAHPLFVDLLERTEAPSDAASPGEPAETSHRAPARRVARDAGAARRPAPARARPAPPAPEPVPPAMPSPSPPVAVDSPAPTAPAPAPEPSRPAAAPAESAPSAAVPSPPSAPAPGSAVSEGTAGSRPTDGPDGDATRGASAPDGSRLAKIAPSGGGGGVPGEYGPYLARFRQRVQEALVYPLAARRQGAQGTVELDVWLEASGRVRDVRVVRSSSNALLDEAALETIRGLGAVPFPDSLPRRPLLIRLPLVFQLQ